MLASSSFRHLYCRNLFFFVKPIWRWTSNPNRMKYNLVFVISCHWFWRDFKWLLQMQILYVVRWNPSYNSSTDVAQMSGEKNSTYTDNFYVNIGILLANLESALWFHFTDRKAQRELREVEWYVQRGQARHWQSQDYNPCLLELCPAALSFGQNPTQEKLKHLKNLTQSNSENVIWFIYRHNLF